MQDKAFPQGTRLFIDGKEVPVVYSIYGVDGSSYGGSLRDFSYSTFIPMDDLADLFRKRHEPREVRIVVVFPNRLGVITKAVYNGCRLGFITPDEVLTVEHEYTPLFPFEVLADLEVSALLERS